MITYPDNRCHICGAAPLAPCVDLETGVEVETHGARIVVSLWRTAVNAVVEAAAADPQATAGAGFGNIDSGDGTTSIDVTFVFPPKKAGDA